MNDPRIYFAAERTFLAWTRTGITLLAFGLVVVRFGLIQEWMEKDAVHTTNVHSLVVGGAFVAYVVQRGDWREIWRTASASASRARVSAASSTRKRSAL